MLYETTVVTAYYPLSHSKYSKQQFSAWIQNFCKIPCAMVFFTTKEYFFKIQQLRKKLSDRTRILVRNFDSFAMTCPSMMKFWDAQVSDTTNQSGEVYAISAIKQECVRNVIQQNPFQSKWFIWCDITIHRYSSFHFFYATFPGEVSRMCPENHMCFLELNEIPDSFVKDRDEEKPMNPEIPEAVLGGGCIVGDKDAWELFGSAYKDMLKEFILKGWFAGNDQNIYFAILMAKKVPMRLFRCKKFGTPAIPGIEWLSFPPMLSGTLDAEVDMRFT